MKQGRTGWIAGAVMFVAVSAAPLSAQYGDGCEHRREISQSLSLASASEVMVAAGAGRLEVRGVRGLREARIRGTACASNARLLSEIGVETSTRGGQARIETSFPDDMRDEHARIDLIVEVPAGMAAEVNDGSGDVELSGLGRLQVHDGSGELVIDDINGDLDIDDGSGSVTVRNVTGAARINDGSGELQLDDVGSVHVSDGSGSIVVKNVRGDFIVDNDGSGDIDFSGVRGRVSVPDRGRWR